MERVSIREGKQPILFIAPHGHPKDDINTANIVESAANYIDAYMVVNNGWKRSKNYDYFADRADCNDINQLIDVPKIEFLDPIVKFKNRILKKHKTAFLFTIHGMANSACNIAKDNNLAMVIGYGAGDPPSYTCQPWMKNLLIYQCQQYGWSVYEGKAGGKYSAWARKNLCQFFRKWQPDQHVQAMQLEIIYDLRDSKAKAELCGECLSDFIKEVTNYGSWTAPHNFKTKKF